MRRYELNMTSGRIWTVLLAFTWPLLLENLLQLLYYTADSVIVGRYVGVSALAAVSATTHICGMLVRFFNGTATGAGVAISRAFGANDRENLNASIKTSLILTLTGCVILTVFGVSMSRFFLEKMSTPPDVIDEADIYLKIYFGGISGLLFYNIGGAILRAMGDTRRPLFFLIVCSVLNIVMDIAFVKIGWGIAGVAIATIAAQALSACLVIYTVVKSSGLYGEWRVDRVLERLCSGIYQRFRDGLHCWLGSLYEARPIYDASDSEHGAGCNGIHRAKSRGGEERPCDFRNVDGSRNDACDFFGYCLNAVLIRARFIVILQP